MKNVLCPKTEKYVKGVTQDKGHENTKGRNPGHS